MTKKKANSNWFVRNYEILLIGIISALSLLVQALDFFGYPPEKYGFNAIDYPKYLIVLLSLISLYLVIRLNSNKLKLQHIDYSSDGEGGIIGKLDNLSNETSFIKALTSQLATNSLKEDVRVFKDSTELQAHLAIQIHNAQKEICDLTWKKRISTGYNVGTSKKAHKFYDDSIAEISKSIKYREIFIFNDSRRYDRFKNRLQENPDGYSCRHYSDHKIPRLQFVIIDDSEVIFFACSENSLLCSIKGNHITKIFKPYFDEIWKSGTSLIEGPKINQKEIDKLDDKFK